MTRRVAVVADGAGFGGAQVYARSLARHAPAGWQVDVVATAEHAPHLRAAGRPVHVVPTAVRADRAPALEAVLRDLRPDLVQVNLVDPASLVASLEAALAVAPTVATLHMRGEVPDPDRVLAAYARLRHVVAVSAEFAEVARAVLRVPAERVTHVLNGVDPVPVVTPPGGDVPVIGALGRLTAQKGFDVLLDAVRLLDRPVRVLLGGEGRERPALAARAEGLDVTFAGFQDGPLPFLAGCDVVAVPSRVEALPLVLLEAVSAGLPCVATDVGDVRRAVGGVVEVVPPEDAAALAAALDALLADPARRAALGAAGARHQREHLTAARMAAQAWAAFTR